MKLCCNPKCRYKCFIREHIVIKAFRIKSYQSFNMLEMNECPNTVRVQKFAKKLKKKKKSEYHLKLKYEQNALL